MMPHAPRHALLLLAVGLSACSGGSDAPLPTATTAPEQSKPRDVIIVTLDTTRADRLGVYGDDKADTPWLDALAARGTRFDRAYAVQPLTIPGHASIFTGLYPFHHGIRSNGDAVLDDRFDTLAERLKAAGYQTGASVAAFVTTRQWGFAQGFDAYFDNLKTPGEAQSGGWHQERPADRVVDDALAWLGQAQADQPVFLWVHLYDPHLPYEPPAEYHERWQSDGYRGELAFVDDQLERLAAGVSQAGREPLWVVVGDHGEGLGEHREMTHGLYAYDATQHVPWIMAGPGVPQAVVSDPVSIVDVSPTVLKLLDRPDPEGLDGRPQPGPARPIYTEAYQLTVRFQYAPHVAVVDGSTKLIDKPRPELYDLAADPGELTNLAEGQPAEVARLRQLLADIGPTRPVHAETSLDPEAVAQLEALGYLSGETYDDLDFDNLPDPLDHQPIINKSQQIELMITRGELDQAIRLLREVVADAPELRESTLRLAGLLVRTDQHEDALVVLEQVASEQIDDPSILYRVAVLMGQSGRHERALAVAEQALALDDDNPGVAEVMVRALANSGRHEDAIAFAEEFVARVPEAPGVAVVPGVLLFDKGDYKAAEPWLRRAMAGQPPAVGIAPRLATLATRAGKLGDAQALLEGELERRPEATRARGQLVGVLLALKDQAGAKAQLDVLLTAALPVDADPGARFERARWHHSRSGLRLDAGDVAGARADVEAGLALLPEDADLVLMLANVQLKEGDREAAVETRKRANALHQQRVEAAKATATPGH